MSASGVNSDLSLPAMQQTTEMAWQASPSATVWRKRLEHFGDNAESDHVTSLVRYDSNSAFSPHGHPDYEEILVLDGIFSDEHGDYPAGTFLLNPKGFRHAPRSADGCTLFVKLCQYPGVDRPQVTIDTNAARWQPHAIDGVESLPLYSSDRYPETVRLVRAGPGVRFPAHNHPGGEEIFLIDGTLQDENGVYGKGAWVRMPHSSTHEPFTDSGATFYVKSGHQPQ